MSAQTAQRQPGVWINPLASFQCSAESAVRTTEPNLYEVKNGLGGHTVDLYRSGPTDAGDLLYSFYYQELSSMRSDLDKCFTQEELANLHTLAGLSYDDTRSW